MSDSPSDDAPAFRPDWQPFDWKQLWCEIPVSQELLKDAFGWHDLPARAPLTRRQKAILRLRIYTGRARNAWQMLRGTYVNWEEDW